MNKYINADVCSECGGRCCKSMGCHFSPEDFKDLSFEGLKAEIEKGFISIDWWEADNPIYFLRMRNKKAEIVDPSWGGECILLTEKGCSLKFEDRPRGARMLIPGENRCLSDYKKEEAVNDWEKYNKVLEELKDYFLLKRRRRYE